MATARLKASTAGLAIALLGLIGVVDAAVLTYDHQKARLGEANATVCQPGGGCAAVRSTPMSEVPLGRYRPALPIALLGLACYLVVAGLGVVRWRKPENPHVPRILFGVGLLATLYSAVLFAYSLTAVGKLCEYCVGLYIVGVALLVVTALSLGEPVLAWFKRVWGSAVSPYGLGALGGFLAVAFAGYQVYASPLTAQIDQAIVALQEEARELPSKEAVTLAVDGRPTEGPADAPVHIVKFADYECGHCGRLYQALHEVMKKRGESVKVTMMNFPLSNKCNPAASRDSHKNACLLAYAGECAHQQGKWPEIAGWLYEHSRSADAAALRAEAERLGMDGEAFAVCVASDETKQRVVMDIKAGIDAGVRATPTFFVNGRKVEGGRPEPVLEAAIDAFTGAAN